MNFDPYDSAAWRTFDMLDADEAAAFDEAMRHDPVLQSAYFEMDRLSAAIATPSPLPSSPNPDNSNACSPASVCRSQSAPITGWRFPVGAPPRCWVSCSPFT